MAVLPERMVWYDEYRSEADENVQTYDDAAALEVGNNTSEFSAENRIPYVGLDIPQSVG